MEATFQCAALRVPEAIEACRIVTAPGKRERHLARIKRCQFRREPTKVWTVGTATSQTAINAKKLLNGGRVNEKGSAIELHHCTVEGWVTASVSS